MDSEENKGSTFSVYLPQDLSVYKPSELASNDELNEEEQVYSTNSKAMYFIDTEKVENESVESGDKKRGTILIVEDNNEIRRYLSNGLADLFNTLEAGNGEEALEKLKDNEVDVIVTDVMMPVMNGIKLCKNVKQNIRTCHIPVIILSAKTDIKDQMEGLQMGADDYIVKPLEMPEVIARVRAVFRRIAPDDAPEKLSFDNLVIDKQAYDLVIKGKRVDAPPKEIELLYFLASSPNRVFTRAQLLDEVWGFDYFGDSRTVDVHIKRLREKVENVSDQWELKTVWGVGYKFEVKK